ncbi:MAG: endonuclease/exonuclease/phosphatase family protein [Gammaproteobacteria bacterium]|nr:endonuclease/exonuclease/phosphatase family protein [Gammaproteobacteria bacterium]
MMIVRLFSVFLLSIVIIACDPFHTTFKKSEHPRYFQSASLSDIPTSGDPLTLMTWNIKFGGARIDFFFDCHGDEVLMTKTETESNLAALATIINDIRPDILFLQEADIGSKRSAYVNEVQWLLDHTELNYAVYASQWHADFVPSDGIGPVDSGNAIFSRWPLNDGERIALPEISAQDTLTRYFYLKRNMLKASINLSSGNTLHLLNTHLAAYAQDDTVQKQLNQLLAEMNTMDTDNLHFIAGGDFNTLPPGSTQSKDFADNVCTGEDFLADDFSEKLDLLTPFYQAYTPAVSLADFQSDNNPYLTHSVSGSVFWNRKIDYLFTNTGFVNASTRVYQNVSNGGYETMPLSDHAPMSVQWSIP